MLLTVAEFQSLSPTSLGDAALQLLLDGAEAEIVAYAGPGGATLELFAGGGRFVSLDRPAASITSITETIYNSVLTLATDDYLLWPGGYSIERLPTGTNPRWNWWGRVAVTYTPSGDDDLRKIVQADLIKLQLNSNPGLTAETIGSWTEQYRASGVAAEERDAILSRLSMGVGMLVVGDRWSPW